MPLKGNSFYPVLKWKKSLKFKHAFEFPYDANSGLEVVQWLTVLCQSVPLL